MAAGLAVKGAAAAGVPGWAITVALVAGVGAFAWWVWRLPAPGQLSARRTWALAVGGAS
jgi:hypothetical protein